MTVAVNRKAEISNDSIEVFDKPSTWKKNRAIFYDNFIKKKSHFNLCMMK